MSVLMAPEWRGVPGVAIDCVRAILAHGFSTWPLNKIYMETSSVALRSFKSAIRSGLFVEEARLVEFELFGDGAADLVYLSVSRVSFEQLMG